MAVVNSDIFLRSLMLQGIFVSFLFLGSKFGDITLAANQVLLQFLHIIAYALDGFAFAAEALVGQALGARNRQGLRRAALLTSGWGFLSSTLLGIGFISFGGASIDLMAKVPEVQIEARNYLIYTGFAAILGLGAFMLDGIFIGATRSRDMRNMMAISLAVYVVALIILMPVFGNHGLWLSLLISYVVRGVTLGLRYPALEAAVGR